MSSQPSQPPDPWWTGSPDDSRRPGGRTGLALGGVMTVLAVILAVLGLIVVAAFILVLAFLNSLTWSNK
jgi:hypothetical protein